MSMSTYQKGWRRLLVDMEIPAWDERFLAEYDPVVMADLYARAGVSSVMFSCKNINGLCFWPTRVGQPHPRTAGRDLVGETVKALDERGIAACAYYSAIFDNWAFEQNPDWRMEPLLSPPTEATPEDRHGVCCLNNPGYRAYLSDQIDDLFGRYEFGCGFCDMSFLPGVCGCRHCRDRFRAETGWEIPETIDWTSERWCAFQAARERWTEDFQSLVTGAMRAASPGISAYHNFAPGPVDWTAAVPFAATEHSDFLAGDMYGDKIEQLVVTKLMNNLSRTRPVEFMTFCTTGYSEHVRLKSPGQLRTQVLAATAESAAFLFIEAIDPVGSANPKVYDLVGEAVAASAGYEPHLGGDPVEDVAVYFSNESKMDFAENGRPLSEQQPLTGERPHVLAVRGACRALQRAHIPFGVITRRQLDHLDDYRVLVLPNVARMDESEVSAIREFVRAGGRVYASGYTSLVETRGVPHEDFMLADVFGVHLEGEEPSPVAYARPMTPEAQAWLEPQLYLGASPESPGLRGGLLRLRAAAGARVHASLTLPYAHPRVGGVLDQDWASIHSFPPFEHTGDPVLVESEYGSGRTFYSAFDVEREEADVNDRLFAGIVGTLLGEEWSVRCDTDAEVWVSAHRQDGAVRVSLLNSPALLVPSTTLRVRVPEGARFVSLIEVPSGRSLPFEVDAHGTLTCELVNIPELTMLLARHTQETENAWET